VAPLRPLPWQQALWDRTLALRSRLPHALLLHGGRGLGKRHFARALAHALLCESPSAAGACGQCPGCELLAAENHPDLRLLVPEADRPERAPADPESEGPEEGADARTAKASRVIRIDAVRSLGEFLALAAHRGGRRVVLIAPAEALNGPAANALLKLLEEPPADAVFVAVTDDLDAVMPTIRSRCVLLRAPVPASDAALAWLRGQGVADADERLAEAGGAPIGLDGPDAAGLDPELKARLLGLLSRGATLGLAEIASALPKDPPVAPAIRLFQRWGWDLLTERAAGRVRYHPRQQRAIAAIGRAGDPVRLLDWLGTLAEAQATAAHPLNPRLVVEQALIGYAEALQMQPRARPQP
jgi:DNA polymerase-3 subunit delta'